MKNLTLITLLSLSVTLTLAAPVPDAPTGAVELNSRWLGAILRGVGRIGGKIPNKVGKQMAKNGGQGQDNVETGKKLQQTTDRWSKHLGKKQDPKCVQGWTNAFSKEGGINAAINCDAGKKGGPGKGGSFYPSTPKGKRELLEGEMEEREVLDVEGLGERDLVPVRGDLLERDFAFEFEVDEREILNLELEERDFGDDFDLNDLE